MDSKAVKFNLPSMNKLAYELRPDYLPGPPHLRASIYGIYEANKEMCHNCERLKRKELVQCQFILI